MSFDDILSRVRRYYDAKIEMHGATAQGVDWNSTESQQMRFEKLIQVIDRSSAFTIDDFGCGYGALAKYLEKEAKPIRYVGFDISPRMIATAMELNTGISWIHFVNQQSDLPRADYAVASGIFNVKLDTPAAEWESYLTRTLANINSLSRRGFAVNFLTKYSDPGFMRPDLYYADPLFFFDYCKTNYSRFVTLLHDYPLYEFTILVRKE
ncbi:MAG: class I SAM-dependent methyltransferase [Acidobacteriota bacterium]|nr:class I SAM-dependent methyltransferase [Acidobacteriota bacterium]